MNTGKFHIITSLLKKRLHERLPVAENSLLEQWLEEAPEHRHMLTRLDDPDLVAEDLLLIDTSRTRIRARIYATRPRSYLWTRTIRSTMPRSYRLTWVAAVLCLLAAGVLWLMLPKNTPQTVQTAPDVPPGGSKAVLTLADGSTVTLDSTGQQLLQQGSTDILQDGGELSYTAKGGGPSAYNKLTTPRGGQFRLRLPDGTTVWLNAASSLYYPTAFNGRERVVEVKGEAYFEVAADPQKPFRVKVNEALTIEVLGTQFNINAYENEHSIRTTLVDGSIRLKGIVLRPGQQAVATLTTLKINDTANLEQVTAWRHGLFNFEGASLEDVMKQLERWYDIDVVYENGIPDIKFGGEMRKDIPLSGLLIMLEKSKVHFRLEGRKLIITDRP